MLRARVLIVCRFCGKDDFRGPKNPGPTDLMLCNGCAMQVPYGELEAEAVARAKRLRQNRDATRGFFAKR